MGNWVPPKLLLKWPCLPSINTVRQNFTTSQVKLRLGENISILVYQLSSCRQLFPC